jgi:hypothetical protein
MMSSMSSSLGRSSLLPRQQVADGGGGDLTLLRPFDLEIARCTLVETQLDRDLVVRVVNLDQIGVLSIRLDVELLSTHAVSFPY